MRSDGAIKTDIYKHLKDSALMQEVTGTLRKTKRPHKSTSEDVIISILANVGVQSQTATVNVNIYVKDNDVDGQFEEDTARVETLCKLAWKVLESFNTDTYNATAIEQRVYETDSGEHVITTQVEYKCLND